MKSQSTLDLEVMALLSEIMFGQGYAHYGYFAEERAPDLTGHALSVGQQAYLDKMADAIPDGVETILEVGSGTGANARALCQRGYAMTCLSPSEQMNEMARAKLPEGTEVVDTTFEAFEHNGRFDICLFAESFHYIRMDAALAQIDRYARDGVVIFDYFRRPGHEVAHRTHSTHAKFLAAVASQGVFEVVSDEDVTAAIVPTFQIQDHIQNSCVAPFLTRFREGLRQSRPMRSWLLERAGRKLMNRLTRRSQKAVSFAEQNEYRLIVMRRRQG